MGGFGAGKAVVGRVVDEMDDETRKKMKMKMGMGMRVAVMRGEGGYITFGSLLFVLAIVRVCCCVVVMRAGFENLDIMLARSQLTRVQNEDLHFFLLQSLPSWKHRMHNWRWRDAGVFVTGDLGTLQGVCSTTTGR